MKKISIFLMVIATMLFTATAATSQEWDLSDPLPADTNFTIGQLENGLTYYIRKAQNPKGRAEFFIIHNVGSLQENEDQRGLAHFLEHMAFNGTKHFPDKQLLEYFAGIGVKFGYNINAYTSMDRTVYNISEVPVNKRSTIIDSALLALHDWSHYISCEPEEIEKERGVVREEWRRGDDARSRMMKGINKVVQQGSRYAERDVIGLMEVVDNFSRQTLIDYYHKWYRPDLQAVVVVGDIDPSDIEQRIKERFSTIPAVENGAERKSYTIPENKEPNIAFLTDPESKATSVRMVIKIPMRSKEERHSLLALHDNLVQNLFHEMLKTRIEAAKKDPDAGFRTIVPIFGNVYSVVETLTMTSMPKESTNTLASLRGIAEETERIIRYGFSEQEVEQAKKAVKTNLEKNYQRSKNPKNSNYVDAVVEHFTRNAPLNDIDALHEKAMEMLATIDKEDLNNSIDRILSEENRAIIFFVPEDEKEYLPTKQEVKEMFREVKESDLARFEPEEMKEISIPKIKHPGTITSSKEVSSKDYGITFKEPLDSTVEWTLSNGATVIWKEEKTEDNNIRMKAFRSGGLARNIDPLELNLYKTFRLYYSINGLDRNELEKWMGSNNIYLRNDIEYRTEEFGGMFKKGKEEKFFSLLYQYFNDVSVSEKAIKDVKRRIIRDIDSKDSENNLFKDSVNALKFSHNPTDVDFTKEYLSEITPENLMSLYNTFFSSPNDYTFIFSGNMSAQEAKPFIEKFIASIPKGKEHSFSANYKEPIYKKGEVYLKYEAKDMLSTKASVNRIYHGEAKYTTENSLLAKFTTYILRDRYMKSIREEKGGTYYVGVTGDLSERPYSKAVFSIDFDTDAPLVDELLEIVQLEIDDLIKNGPTEKEMNEIELYLKKVYKDKKNDKDTDWITIIKNGITGREDISLEEEKYLVKVTPSKVRKFAKSIFKTGNKMTFVFQPE